MWEQFSNYISKATTEVNSVFAFIITAISYIMFPEEAYATAALALGGAILMDIISKYTALSVQSKGLRKAFKEGKIFSKSLWEGTRIKLMTYLSISIMVGLSYRLNALPSAFTAVSKFMATVIYTVLFLREFQSMLENFRDAGADVEWLLKWSRKKEKEILDSKDIDSKFEGEGEDETSTI